MTERDIKLVVTNKKSQDDSDVTCANCSKCLAHVSADGEHMEPSFQELWRNGAVPVPNFGWFCCQECGKSFSETQDVQFNEDENGSIAYYTEDDFK